MSDNPPGGVQEPTGAVTDLPDLAGDDLPQFPVTQDTEYDAGPNGGE